MYFYALFYFILSKGAFTDQHFDQDFNFYATEEDPVTKKVDSTFEFNFCIYCLKTG